MNRIPISIETNTFPSSLQQFLIGAPIYDSSCSPEARVYFIDRDNGFYLKTAATGTLKEEAAMTSYFHRKGLSAEVLVYEQLDRDWLLTRRISGEDCIHRQYLNDPKRLSETLGILLRMLHETDAAECPIPDRNRSYLDTVGQNYRSGRFDLSLFPDDHRFSSADDAWAVVQAFAGVLKKDVLLHGDYCLPNIMLDNWQFSGFLDLGCGGIGDRHIDLFWGAWTLIFNLKTDIWCSRFLDAYGRDKIEPEILQAIPAFEVFR